MNNIKLKNIKIKKLVNLLINNIAIKEMCYSHTYREIGDAYGFKFRDYMRFTDHNTICAGFLNDYHSDEDIYKYIIKNYGFDTFKNLNEQLDEKLFKKLEINIDEELNLDIEKNQNRENLLKCLSVLASKRFSDNFKDKTEIKFKEIADLKDNMSLLWQDIIHTFTVNLYSPDVSEKYKALDYKEQLKSLPQFDIIKNKLLNMSKLEQQVALTGNIYTSCMINFFNGYVYSYEKDYNRLITHLIFKVIWLRVDSLFYKDSPLNISDLSDLKKAKFFIKENKLELEELKNNKSYQEFLKS